MARTLQEELRRLPVLPELRIGHIRLGPPTLAGILMLAGAAIPMVVGPPSWITVILAGVATLLLALDRRLGWLPAGLVALIALPYGRGADVLSLSIEGWPVRPPDAVIGVALIGALTQLPQGWRANIRRQPVLLGAFLAFAGLGLIALIIGLNESHEFRHIVRDGRFWGLYLVGALALLTGVRRAAVVRALLLGGAIFSIVVFAIVLLPIFEGGLKAQALVYDRGTLRMQYGNSVYLLPIVAICATSLLRRFSPATMSLLVLALAALVLSLTRMSIAAAGVVVAAAVVLAFWHARPAFLQPQLVGRVLTLAAVCAVGTGLAVLLIVSQPRVSDRPGPAGEDPLARLLGRSEQSSIEEIATSSTGRLASYWEAWAIIRQAPLLGAGMGKLVPVEFAYSPARAHVVGMQPGVDNAYLTFGVKAGLVGMATIAVLLLWPLFVLYRGASSRIRPWFIAGWVGILLLTMTQSFAAARYGPFGLTLLIVLPSLQWVRLPDSLRHRT